MVGATGASAQMPTPLLPDAMTATPTAPPALSPTVPVAPPVPVVLPQLSDAQSAFLIDWLARGSAQGLTADARGGAALPTSALAGDALVRAALDRARALRTGRIDTTDFLDIWALRPEAYDPLPALTHGALRLVRRGPTQDWALRVGGASEGSGGGETGQVEREIRDD